MLLRRLDCRGVIPAQRTYRHRFTRNRWIDSEKRPRVWEAQKEYECVSDARERHPIVAQCEAVEFPFGSLMRVNHTRKEQRGRFLGEMRSIYTKLFAVTLEVNSEGEKLLQKRTARRQDLLAALRRRRPAPASNSRRSQP